MRRVHGGAALYAVVIAVWAASVMLWILPGYVRPDGAGYAAYLPSAWFDHDLLLFDEWSRFGMIRGDAIAFTNVTANGHLSDHWTVGAAVVWLPAFAAAAVARDALPMLRGFPRDGVSLPYAIAVVVTSAMAGLATLLIGTSIATASFGAFDAGLAALAVWFGSPLLWYATRHASMAHAVSAAACAVVVAVALSLRRRISWSRVFAAGLACGFAFMVRPQNLTFVLVPPIVVGFLPLLRRSWIAAIGFVIGTLPELVVSQVIYGNPLAFASSGGANDWHSFERVRLWLPLGSWYHGMFPWTPLLAVALAGLVLLWWDDRRLAAAGLVTFVLQWLIISAFDRSFWGMLAFGQRRFDQCSVFFLIGLATLFTRLPRIVAIVIAAVGAGWTMLLFLAAPHLNLNAYIPPRTLWHAAMLTLQRDRLFVVLQSVAPPERTAALVVMLLVVAIVSILVALAVWTDAAVAATVYLVTVSAFLAWCGSHDAARTLAYRSLLEANRRGSARDGHALDYLGLLQRERDYFRAVGNTEEAASSQREAATFARAHGFAQ